MTATATRAAPAPPPPASRTSPVPPSAGAAGPQRGPGPGAAVNVALVAYTTAVVIGFGRLFADGSFFWPLAAAAWAGHAAAAVARRRRLRGVTSALVAVVSGIWLATLAFYARTTWALLPTGRTLGALRLDGREAWQVFGDVRAPAPVLPGFLVAGAAAVWLIAWFSDWAAFRVRTVLEPLLPGLALFLFAAILGAPGHRIAVTALFVVAGLAFVLLQRLSVDGPGPGWVRTHGPSGRQALLRGGGALAVLAALAAGVVGPRLPGATSKAWLDWRGGAAGQGTRVTVSPLVDLRDRLVAQSSVELFEVRSNIPTYWRLTALDRFDGNVWSSDARFEAASGDLPSGRRAGEAPNAQGDVAVQEFRITSLSTLWAPAAFQPDWVDPASNALRWDPESSTLVVAPGRSTSDGMTYRVNSFLPRLTAAQLDTPEGLPGSISRRYLDLPSNFPEYARRTARRVTAGARTLYQQARLLQDWFRTEFTYDLAGVPAGQDNSTLVRFLNTKRGFCQQFAGAYAAMARSLGLPARVAVGFTPGERDPKDPNLYHVKGRQAHAWPEVYLPSAGWVPFEPTPSRGMPGATAWTGVRPQQDTGGAAVRTTPTTQGSIPQLGTLPPEFKPRQVRTVGRVTPPPSLRPRAGAGSAVVRDAGRALLVSLALAAAWVVSLAAARTGRRAWRRRRASTPQARVRVAWREAAEAASGIAGPPGAHETHSDYAARAAPALGAAAAALHGLAVLSTELTWAPPGATGDDAAADDAAARAERWRNEVLQASRHHRGSKSRLVAAVNPRPLLG
ncbi:MAG: transglutaminase domain-containing protein [Actinobacteria bacterium]|nr:transglutaminase domain-containing protein [Actinomycetota bacterium]